MLFVLIRTSRKRSAGLIPSQLPTTPVLDPDRGRDRRYIFCLRCYNIFLGTYPLISLLRSYFGWLVYFFYKHFAAPQLSLPLSSPKVLMPGRHWGFVLAAFLQMPFSKCLAAGLRSVVRRSLWFLLIYRIQKGGFLFLKCLNLFFKAISISSAFHGRFPDGERKIPALSGVLGL